jgi:hypothetical protein
VNYGWVSYSHYILDSAIWPSLFVERFEIRQRSQVCDRDKEEIALDYTESLDLADKDINDNWDIYQERFLRGDFP